MAPSHAASITECFATAISLGAVVGAFTGVIDGLDTLSRNAFAPRFAFLCISAPIVLTTVVLSTVSLALSVPSAIRRLPKDQVLTLVAPRLVALVVLLWALRWWTGVAHETRQFGGGGVILVLILGMLLVLVAACWWLTGKLLALADRQRVVRMMRVSVVIIVVANAALSLGLIGIAFREGRKFLHDDLVGHTRQADELNILLITIDTLRADRVVSSRETRNLTPRLDRLAAEGVLFTNAISSSSWTLPAIASIFTGLMPHRHGAGWSQNGFDLLARTPMLSSVWSFTEALRRHGYLTGAIVTNPYLSMHFGIGRGFHSYENITMESEGFLALAKSLVGWLFMTFVPQVAIGDVGETVTARAQRWIERHRTERFFLWLHYIDVHAPYGDPRILGHKSFRGDVLTGNELAAVFRTPATASLGDRFVNIARLRAGEVHLDADQRRQLIDLYDTGVRYEDEQIGHVLDQVDKLGLRQHTLVVVTSDHGEEFWEHGGVEHGHTLYDELLRVPLIVRYPGGPTGIRIDALVSTVDVAPTIVEIVGAPRPPVRVNGRSLTPLLRGHAEESRLVWSEALLFSDEKRMAQNGKYKYIVWQNGKEELYDLQSDPGEQRDLAGRAELLGEWRTAMRGLPNVSVVREGERAPLEAQPGRELLRILGYGE